MYRASLFILMIVLTGCSNTISKENLANLDGYWEITEVQFPSGAKKNYTVNPSIDYIEIDKMTGFKKKMSPKFDGSYDTSNDAEIFTIIEKDGQFILSYENKLSKWEERLSTLTKDTFSVINEDNITYKYKRYEPINITE